MTMSVSIYGVGYVGLVTGVCLAKLGHSVCCYDIDSNKIVQLQQGQPPIYEEQLELLLAEMIQASRIEFTDQFEQAVHFSNLHIIAVGTPPSDDGSADLSHVLDVADRLAQHLKPGSLIVNKSTVPVGTADRVQQRVGASISVASNPEFLKEGKAIEDFLYPARILIGVKDENAAELLQQLYRPLTDQGIPLLSMTPRAAEFSKYASNAFLATKISFMNEMSQLAERFSVDIEQVKTGMGLDPRIGKQFLNPGCGYGGSCFPKDVDALIAASKERAYEPQILSAVQATNDKQKMVLFDKISRYFSGDLQGRCIALWGLAFKPGTDDIRCAPSLRLMELLWEAGAKVQAFDPMAMPTVERAYPNKTNLRLCTSPEATLKSAHALAIVTEWPIFLDVNLVTVKQNLIQPIIFDGRNLLDPKRVADVGLQYCGIGRGLSIVSTRKEDAHARETTST